MKVSRRKFVVTLAVLCCWGALESLSGQDDSQLNQAKTLLEKRMFSDAAAVTGQYLESHPNSADGHNLLGLILFREVPESSLRGRLRGPHYREAMGIDPKFVETNARASLVEYRKAVDFRPSSPSDLKIVALDFVLLGNYVDADKWLSKSVQRDPKDAQAWCFLSRIKYDINHFDEAITASKECLQRDSQNSGALDTMGLAYAEMSRTDDAIKAYRAAIELQAKSLEKDPYPFLDLADLFLKQGRAEQAVPLLAKAVDISPELANAHQLLGKAYLRMNQLQESARELEKTIELEPDCAPAHYLLGQVYRKAGQADKATKEFDKSAALYGTRSTPDVP
jgi:tetratricopeptide (TPR) repeat protein